MTAASLGVSGRSVWEEMGHGESVKPLGPYNRGMVVDLLHELVEEVGLETLRLSAFRSARADRAWENEGSFASPAGSLLRL